MADSADIYIAGKLVARPANVDIGYFDLTKSERSSSGLMLMEIIRKDIRRVDVSWSYLPDDKLFEIIQTISNNKPFFTLKYLDTGGYNEIICYAGDIRISTWQRIGGVRYWKEVAIPFIER